MCDGCPRTAHLRLTAEQLIFRLLGVSEERILDHAEHVASAGSPLLSPLLWFAVCPPGCPCASCLFKPTLSLSPYVVVSNPWDKKRDKQQVTFSNYPDAPTRKFSSSSREECALCASEHRALLNRCLFFLSRRQELQMLTPHP